MEKSHFCWTTFRGAGHPDTQPRNWPPPWRDAFWTNWALVVVGLLAGGAAIWTLLAIRNQTQAIRDQTEQVKTAAVAALENARAAKWQAQAIVNAERAWLIGARAEEDITVDLFGNPAHIPQSQIGIINTGRTPGKIVTVCLKFEKINDLQKLATEPYFDGVRPYFGIDDIKGLGELIVIPSQTAIWITVDIQGGEPLSQQERVAVKDGKLFLVCWGEINYTDVVTKDAHVTRFCYVYTHGSPFYKNAFQVSFVVPPQYRETT